MPLIVQTNDSVTGANSYASVTDLTTYTGSRGITLKGAPEQLLLLAMDVLESKQYKGEPFKSNQTTAFPRKVGVGIPRAIKQAQVMLAVSLDGAPPVNEVPAAQVSREKVDVIEVQYFEAKDNQSALLKMVDELLAPYLAGVGIGVNFRVYRG